MFKKAHSSVIKFFDYLEKNPSDAVSFWAFFFGLMILWIGSNKDSNVDLLGMIHVFGITF